VIEGHLSGRHTIGVYPLLPEETCFFLAADFDKDTWMEDAGAFLETCERMSVPAALERSRSGNGGHVWIFFEGPLQATMARKLGSAILTATMERLPRLGFESYDRFFPSQDTMPRGGFGNLIALPLQLGCREEGNTVFLDKRFNPYEDQWAFLSGIRKMKQREVEEIVLEARRMGRIIGLRMSLTEEGVEDPWTLPPSGAKHEETIEGPFPDKVNIVRGNMVYIEKEGLPSAVINRLLRLAAFQNPEFYRAQAMRMSTFGKPRIISCAEDFGRHIGLPRGLLNEASAFFGAHGIRMEIKDERFSGVPLSVSFHGTLRPLQEKAANAIMEHDIGILSAPTAFGKTAVAAYLIAERKVNTLVLVHRKLLMDQWHERLRAFLEMATGQVGGGKNSKTGLIDIAMIQSLARKGIVSDIIAEYGQIIVDECHHVSAFSFEQVLKQAKARYVTGLTATPFRKDGHHPIIMMQCGPIRFRGDARKAACDRPFGHVVITRHTEFSMPGGSDDSIQAVYTALMGDEKRNTMILDDILEVIEAGRVPLLLTERTGHVDEFAMMLKGFVKNILVIKGGMGKKKLKALMEQMASITEDEERVIIATGRCIGEGFDDSRLDTLFLAMPVSWRGTLQQYAGRLHRLHESKKEVRIYDYVDQKVPVLARMYEKRLRGYSALGYSIQR